MSSPDLTAAADKKIDALTEMAAKDKLKKIIRLLPLIWPNSIEFKITILKIITEK
jgi:hypothetical protein